MVGLAVPMLGEPVGWRRWSAVAVGFVGVMVMLDPWTYRSTGYLAGRASRDLLLLAVDSAGRLISRHDHDAATIFWFCLSRQRGVAGRRHPGLGVAVARRLALADVHWACSAGSARSWSPGRLAARAGSRAGALRLCSDRAGGSLRLSVVQGGTVLAVWYGLPLVIGSGLYILHRERVRAREPGLPADD